MKKVLALIFAVSAICSSKAMASYDNCLCWTNISVDGGHSSTACTDDGTLNNGCECTAESTGCYQAYTTTNSACSLGSYQHGTTATGKLCCVKGTCLTREQQQQQLPQDVQSLSDDSSLQTVFGDRSTAYFGYVDTNNRSSTYGRTVSIDARLDACMGNTAVDQITASSSDQYSQWQTCTGSNYCGNTLVNGYCSANSNQVCLDRCNCKYQAYLATIGVNVTCSNL